MNNNQPIYMTAEGLHKIKEELVYLTTVRRREVAQMIAEAKAEGDISENAGYDEAKTAQGFLEGKIRDLEAVIKNAIVIDESEAPRHSVAIGRTINVREVGSDEEEVYTIVGSKEADPANGRISNESPMGKALLGKAVGDVVKVATPGGGEIEFEILGVS
jgi:transcription elongation factor GreA